MIQKLILKIDISYSILKAKIICDGVKIENQFSQETSIRKSYLIVSEWKNLLFYRRISTQIRNDFRPMMILSKEKITGNSIVFGFPYFGTLVFILMSLYGYYWSQFRFHLFLLFILILVLLNVVLIINELSLFKTDYISNNNEVE